MELQTAQVAVPVAVEVNSQQALVVQEHQAKEMLVEVVLLCLLVVVAAALAALAVLVLEQMEVQVALLETEQQAV